MDLLIGRISNYRVIFLFFLASAALFLFATISKYFLPSSSQFFSPSEPSNLYKNYPFERAFGLKSTQASQSISASPSRGAIQTLDGLTLKAVFSERNGGFVVVEDGKVSNFIGLNEEFKGYKLTRIEPRKAIFERNSIEYEISMIDTTPAYNQPVLDQKPMLNRSNTNQRLDKITRKELERYKNDARLIWDNIGINPITQNGQFKEFRVTFVTKGSIFEQLGIMPGDVLKSANGVELDGYASALKLYSEMDKIEFLRLEIIRNNQIRELTYEIN